jgi:hypothetical protein
MPANNATKTGGAAMKCSWTIAVLIALCATATKADDSAPGVATIGTGTFSCAKFAKYDAAPNNSDQMNLIIQWAWGFISAYNLRAAFSATFQENDAPNPVTPPNATSVVSSIRKFCQKNPQGNLTDATLELIGTSGGIVTSSVTLPQT